MSDDGGNVGNGGSGDAAAGPQGFEIEYRWDRLPEEDEQAGVWLVFATSLVLTVVLAMDACNGTGGGGDSGDEFHQVGGLTSSSSSLPPSGRSGREGHEEGWVGRDGGGGGVWRPSGGVVSRRRR